MAYIFNAAGNGSAPLVVPVGGPPGQRGPAGADSTVPGPEGRQGPAGRDGAQGPAGAGAISSRQADTSVPLWSAVVASDANRCIPADPSNPAHRGQVIGVTAYGGMAGGQVEIQSVGDLLGPVASFTEGSALFVGAGGILTPTPPASGWRQIVATAVSSSQIVVALGEARVVADEGTALVVPSGFASKATEGDISAGSGEGWTNVDQTRQMVEAFGAEATYSAPFALALARTLADKVADFGSTPLDYISSASDRWKVRLGAADAPACDEAFRRFFADLVANAGNTGVRAYIPSGVYKFDRAVEVELFSDGVNQRRYCLDFAPGVKLVHTDANRYRYVVLGPWDAAASPALISSGSGAVGDAYVAITANDSLNIDGIKSINVGDTAYRGVNGWQKILCKADYHHQYWDASDNLDGQGNLVIFPGVGRENECWVVGKSGSANIGPAGAWTVGQEAIFVWGAWRRKTVRGGTFKGYWNPRTNTTYLDDAGTTVLAASPALSNSPTDPKGGTAGDWYIVIGQWAVMPISLNNNHITGLGESYIWQPGQKVWCIERGKWHKCYASPTPRGRWNPTADTYSGKYHPATAPSSPVAVPNTYAQPTLSDTLPLQSKGEYAATFEVTFPGTGTVGGITRNWRRGEYIFRGPNGYEFIARDPNYERGIFLFHIDDKSMLHIHGTLPLISRDTSGLTGGYSAGVALRVWSVYRAGYLGYLFGSPMLWIKGSLCSESDSDNPSDAASKSGIWEKILETKYLYLPRIEDVRVRSTYALGQDRIAHMRQFPRTAVNCIHHVDAYVGVIAGGNINGPYFDAIRYDSDGWNEEQYSYEGGHVVMEGASVMTMLYINHGWRGTPGLWRSTFEVEMSDVGFSEFAVRVKGHVGVKITLNRPILPGISGIKDYFTEQPAAVMLEDCSSVRVDAGIPAAGSIIDADRFASVLRTRANVTDVSLRGDFGQMDGGAILNLKHNGNENAKSFYFGFPQQYADGDPRRDVRVTLKDTTGLGTDTPTKALLRGQSSLVKGEEVLLDLVLRKNLVMGQGSGLVMGPFIFNTTSDKLLVQRASDGVALWSLDLNGTPRSLGPVLGSQSNV